MYISYLIGDMVLFGKLEVMRQGIVKVEMGTQTKMEETREEGTQTGSWGVADELRKLHETEDF